MVSKAKHILSSAIARCIVADAKRKGKRPPPFEGTRALVERQGWRKIIRLTAKCFLLLPLQRFKGGETMPKENTSADEKRRRAEKERERRENLRSWATLAAVTVTAIINTAAIILQLTR